MNLKNQLFELRGKLYVAHTEVELAKEDLKHYEQVIHKAYKKCDKLATKILALENKLLKIPNK